MKLNDPIYDEPVTKTLPKYSKLLIARVNSADINSPGNKVYDLTLDENGDDEFDRLLTSLFW